MIKILLNNNEVSIIDECDKHLVNFNKRKWYLRKDKSKRTGYVAQPFKKENGKWSQLFLHHAILGYPLNDLQIDHINGNGLDNRRNNLRIVTRRQNQRNRFCYGNKKSKYIGVYWHRPNKKWYAQISYGGKQHHIGFYKNQEDASQAYMKEFEKLDLR